MSKKSNAPDSQFERIVLFQEQSIRRTWHNNEWWFAVLDVVVALTDSANPTEYIKKMRLRDSELAKGWGQFVTPFALRPKAVFSKPIAPMPKGCFALFKAFPRPKLSRSNAGWRRWVMSG
jgi:DNA-damage-inducible protein D